MNWGSPGNDEDGDLSMWASHSSYLPYYYLEHLWGRVVEYAIRNSDGDLYASGEGGLSGEAGTHGQVELWVLDVQIISLTHYKSNQILFTCI